MKKQLLPFLLVGLVGSVGVSQEDDPLGGLEDDSAPQMEEVPASGENSDFADEFSEDAPSSSTSSEPTPAPEMPSLSEEPAAPEVAQPVAPEASPTLAEPEATEPAADPFATSAQSDEPDYELEKKFHSIYKRYNSQPTSIEEWEKVVGARESRSYEVQKGDTLWDVSKTLFGDPNYWPKVWALNAGAVTNPHQINPRLPIQFYPGTASEAPTMSVGEPGSVPAPLMAPLAQATPGNDKDLIPPPRRASVPPLRVLPRSLPAYTLGQVDAPKPALEIELPKNRFATAPEYLTQYLIEGDLAKQGEVTETEMGLGSASDFQYLFVRLEGPATQGSRYQVVKSLRTVQSVAGDKNSPTAQVVQVQGIVEILEQVNQAENIYRAIVKQTLSPLTVGAVLVPGNLPVMDKSNVAVGSGPSVKIIGGEGNLQANVFGNHSLVYLNGGSSVGLQEGQGLIVQSVQQNRVRQSKAIENDRVVGAVKILKVTSNFSTAVVLSAQEDIRTGDLVGGGARAALSPGVAPSTELNDELNDFELEDSAESLEPSAPVEQAPSEESDLSDDELDF